MLPTCFSSQGHLVLVVLSYIYYLEIENRNGLCMRYDIFWKEICFFMICLFIREREREWAHNQGEWQAEVEGGRGRGRSRLPAEQGAQCKAWSYDPGIMTWAEGRCLSDWAPRHPGNRSFYWWCGKWRWVGSHCKWISEWIWKRLMCLWTWGNILRVWEDREVSRSTLQDKGYLWANGVEMISSPEFLQW